MSVPPTASGPATSLLLALLNAALAGVDAERLTPPLVSDGAAARAPGRLLVIGLGKAGAAMTRGALSVLERPLQALTITPAGYDLDLQRPNCAVESICAGHPVPDGRSQAAATRALQLAGGLGHGDALLALMSGGGSALMCAPSPGVSLEEKQELTRALLRSGATIAEINCVRKHLSSVKGGRLALAAFPAIVETLVLSDIPGDDLRLVASGPTLPDETTLAMARSVIEAYALRPSNAVLAALSDPANETLKPDHPSAGRLSSRRVARASDALASAAAFARADGCQVENLGDQLEGEARSLGAAHAAEARARQGGSGRRVLLSGGEATVTVRNPRGRGGPNLEYLLGLALALNGASGVFAVACDTDGWDGSEPVAGAMIGPTTLLRGAALGLDARAMLEANLSYDFFAGIGDLVVTGPTRTNVNDFRAILIEGVGT